MQWRVLAVMDNLLHHLSTLYGVLTKNPPINLTKIRTWRQVALISPTKISSLVGVSRSRISDIHTLQ